MAITETRTFVRSTTDGYYPDLTTSSILTAHMAKRQAPIASGALTFTTVPSDDGNTRTSTAVYATISDWNAFLNDAITIEYQHDLNTHTPTGDDGKFEVSYNQSGIDAPFVMTTSYTFPTAGLSAHDTLVTAINENNAVANKLTNLTVTDTVVTAVHTYANSADYTTNHWNDLKLIADLQAAGVTRNITIV